MTQGKSSDEIKQIAQNLCKEKNIDVDEAMKMFEGQIGNMFGGMK